MNKKLLMITMGMMLYLMTASPAALADAQGMVAEHLVAQGKTHYLKGRYVEAMHEFGKALMVDPNNIEAQEYLQDLGYYGSESTALTHVAVMNHSIKNLKERVHVLERENRSTTKENFHLSDERDDLKDALSNEKIDNLSLRKELKELSKIDRSKIKSLERSANSKDSEMKKLEKQVIHLEKNILTIKDKSAEKVAMIKQKEQQIKELERDLRAVDRRWLDKTYDYEDIIQDLKRDFNTYKFEAKRRSDLQKSKVSDLQTVLSDKRNDINALHQRLIAAEQKSVKHASVLESKNERISQLEGAVGRLESQLAKLRARVTATAAAVQASGGSKVEDLSSRNEDIKFIKRQDRLIADLKERLLKAQQKTSSVQPAGLSDKRMQAFEMELASLKDKVDSLNKELQSREILLAQRDSEYHVLEERLRDTHQRLEMVDGIMEKKNNQIKELESQITEILSQFAEEGENLK